MTHNKTTVTTHSVNMYLNQSDIIALLCTSGEEVPKNATVSFTIPSGDNWSGQTLELTDNYVINVEYKIVEEK